MKNLYTYYPEFDTDDCLVWHVLETATNQIVESFYFEDDAQHWCKFWSEGGGFAGFTPRFLLTKVSKGDINEAFLAEFAE